MRHFLFTILLGLILHSTSGWSDPMVSGEESGEYVIKHIVDRVGERIRALVTDSDGNLRQIVFFEADAREKSRGLWVVRAGSYPSEF